LHLHITEFGVWGETGASLALLGFASGISWHGGAGSISERASGVECLVWGMDGDFWLAWDLYFGIKGAVGDCIGADLLR